jgi:hypothetical protein
MPLDYVQMLLIILEAFYIHLARINFYSVEFSGQKTVTYYFYFLRISKFILTNQGTWFICVSENSLA